MEEKGLFCVGILECEWGMGMGNKGGWKVNILGEGRKGKDDGRSGEGGC